MYSPQLQSLSPNACQDPSTPPERPCSPLMQFETRFERFKKHVDNDAILDAWLSEKTAKGERLGPVRDTATLIWEYNEAHPYESYQQRRDRERGPVKHQPLYVPTSPAYTEDSKGEPLPSRDSLPPLSTLDQDDQNTQGIPDQPTSSTSSTSSPSRYLSDATPSPTERAHMTLLSLLQERLPRSISTPLWSFKLDPPTTPPRGPLEPGQQYHPHPPIYTPLDALQVADSEPVAKRRKT